MGEDLGHHGRMFDGGAGALELYPVAQAGIRYRHRAVSASSGGTLNIIAPRGSLPTPNRREAESEPDARAGSVHGLEGSRPAAEVCIGTRGGDEVRLWRRDRSRARGWPTTWRAVSLETMPKRLQVSGPNVFPLVLPLNEQPTSTRQGAPTRWIEQQGRTGSGEILG